MNRHLRPTNNMVVHNEIPEDWDRHVPPGFCGVDRRWTELSLNRLPATPTVFDLIRNSRVAVRLLGSVATAPCGNSRLDAYSIVSGHSTHLGLAVSGPWPWAGLAREDLYPSLVVMLPNYRTVPLGESAQDPDALCELLYAVGRWRRNQGIKSVAVLYASAQSDAFRESMRVCGAQVFPLTEECVLHVEWPDFDGYLAALSSKRRISVRRELRALSEADITVGQLPVGHRTEELLELRCRLIAKYSGQPNMAKERNYLAEVRHRFGDSALSVFATEKSGQLLNFGLFVQEEHCWMALLTGSDYSQEDSRLGYFSTLFYEPARIAPNRGVTTIQYGLGSWAAKKSRGCHMQPLWAAATMLEAEGAL